jgi:hypothetical protein
VFVFKGVVGRTTAEFLLDARAADNSIVALSKAY